MTACRYSKESCTSCNSCCARTPQVPAADYSSLPKFGPKHKSLMCKVLTEEMFEELKDKKTAKGYTLSQAIQTGTMTPHLGVGCTAGDEESWTTFKALYYPVIKGWHNFDPETQNHRSDLDPEQLRMTDAQVEMFNEYVVSTRIRAARNISGFALPAGTDDADRKGVRETLCRAFDQFEGELAGERYYTVHCQYHSDCHYYY
jgi:creatine kinase